MPADLLGLGECLIEFSRQSKDSSDWSQGYSGDILNTLSLASSLGVSTQILTRFGSDTFTDGLFEFLRAAGIGRELSEVGTEPNGVYFLTPSANGEADFHFRRENSAARQTLRTVGSSRLAEVISHSEIFFFTAIGAAVMHESEILVEAIRNAPSANIAFDNNFRASLWPDVTELHELLTQIAPSVTTLFISHSDHVGIYSRTGETPSEILRWYHDLGFAHVVLRWSERGAYTIEDGALFHVPAYASTLLDATGAGDGFNAGYLAEELRGGSLADRIISGNAAASMVVETRGGRLQNFFREEFERRKTILVSQ